MRNWNAARVFSHKEIKAATNNFKEVIGRGSFGSVYLGKLSDGKQVAVKVRFDRTQLGADSFINEVHCEILFHYCFSLVCTCVYMSYLHLYFKSKRTNSSLPVKLELTTWDFLLVLPLPVGASPVTNSPPKSGMFGRVLLWGKAANTSLRVSTWRIVGWSPLWYAMHALIIWRIFMLYYAITKKGGNDFIIDVSFRFK